MIVIITMALRMKVVFSKPLFLDPQKKARHVKPFRHAPLIESPLVRCSKRKAHLERERHTLRSLLMMPPLTPLTAGTRRRSLQFRGRRGFL